jgi:two-component system sensor histidine kinase/response regulator
MGGRVWVESELGRGSTFHFTAKFGVAASESSAVEQQQIAGVRGTPVLIVDDSATTRVILDEMLRSWETEPTAVSDEESAFRELTESQKRGEPHRVMLVDDSLPGVDSFALVKRVKDDPKFDCEVVMMLAAGHQPGYQQTCEQLGIAGHLIKPIKSSELLETIANITGVTIDESTILESSAPQGGSTGPLQVLLAEDSLFNQKLAVGLLEKHNHVVTVVGDGKQALATLQKREFDLVLMDVEMPELDGLEATRKIRKTEETTGRHVPIVAMTAQAMKGDRERCLDAGMDGYVAKPIRVQELWRTIERVVARRAPAGAGQSDAALKDQDNKGPDGGDQVNGDQGNGTVNWAKALASTGGDRQLLVEIIDVFRDEAPKLLADVRQAVDDQDADTLRRVAHTIKGSLRMLGHEQAAAVAEVLEAQGRAGDFANLDLSVTSLQSQVEHLMPELAVFSAEPTAPGDGVDGSPTPN